MAYDEELADRIREHLATEPDTSEKRMFGGLAFLVAGHMAVAAGGQGGIMVRVDPADTETLVAQPHVDRMVMQGRSMDGWLRVEAPAISDDDALSAWVERGVAFVRTLPPKD